jgi:hypothetical protein
VFVGLYPAPTSPASPPLAPRGLKPSRYTESENAVEIGELVNDLNSPTRPFSFYRT